MYMDGPSTSSNHDAGIGPAHSHQNGHSFPRGPPIASQDYDNGRFIDLNFGDESFGNGFGEAPPLIFHQADSLELGVYADKPPKIVQDRYLMGEVLGQGTYGKVKAALDMRNLQRMAIKIMNKQKLKKIPNGEQNALNEYQIMRKLSHPNVVRVFGLLKREASETSPFSMDDEPGDPDPDPLGLPRGFGTSVTEKLYLLMEYCVCGLNDLLDNAPDKKLPTWQAHKYFVDLMLGVEYLHSQRVVHKDIKPSNLLVSTKDSLKIADFGVAEELSMYNGNDEITSSAGTPMFQPPEVARGDSPSFPGFKLDVWCSGITLYNITTATFPFQGGTVYLLLNNISTPEPVTIPSELPSHLRALLAGMLHKDPAHRFNLHQVMSHQWFTQKHCVTPERVLLPQQVSTGPPLAPDPSQPESALSPNHSLSQIVHKLDMLFFPPGAQDYVAVGQAEERGGECESLFPHDSAMDPASAAKQPYHPQPHPSSIPSNSNGAINPSCAAAVAGPGPVDRGKQAAQSPPSSTNQMPLIKPAAKHKKKACEVM